ncbi:hypothetical protein P8452_55408 [Trifolium repens]|jgi:hypothetical protein|nr:hypothetical protein P8452_51053 [Trifolium repens]WJX71411.1 hypothetical protein P8452_55408 [Trifolium repens]
MVTVELNWLLAKVGLSSAHSVVKAFSNPDLVPWNLKNRLSTTEQMSLFVSAHSATISLQSMLGTPLPQIAW